MVYVEVDVYDDDGGPRSVRSARLPDGAHFECVWRWIGGWGGDAEAAVRYTDDEGDEISVFNQREWEECLRVAGDAPVRLAVHLTRPHDDACVPETWDGQ